MDDNKKLKPFNQVLVRDSLDEKWTADIFSHYNLGVTYSYGCIGNRNWKYCIPYKDNEVLLGIDDVPDCEHKDFTFLQKVIAWNPGFPLVKGYFLDKIEVEGRKIRYKVVNIKTKDMEYFKDCVPEEWEE